MDLESLSLLEMTITSIKFWIREPTSIRALLDSLALIFLSFSPSIYSTYVMSLKMSISLTSIALWHSFTTKLDNLEINLLIQAQELATKEGAYLNNVVNLRAYSLTLVPPYLRLIKFITYAFLNSTGKSSQGMQLWKPLTYGTFINSFGFPIYYTNLEQHLWVIRSPSLPFLSMDPYNSDTSYNLLINSYESFPTSEL